MKRRESEAKKKERKKITEQSNVLTEKCLKLFLASVAIPHRLWHLSQEWLALFWLHVDIVLSFIKIVPRWNDVKRAGATTNVPVGPLRANLNIYRKIIIFLHCALVSSHYISSFLHCVDEQCLAKRLEWRTTYLYTADDVITMSRLILIPLQAQVLESFYGCGPSFVFVCWLHYYLLDPSCIGATLGW